MTRTRLLTSGFRENSDLLGVLSLAGSENLVVVCFPGAPGKLPSLRMKSLRTVPTIAIAHTFCASPDTRISYQRCLIIQGYFCTVQNYAEKAELSKCSWYPKRKLGVATHFSEIIKLEFGKERHTLLCILKIFTNID